MAGNEAENDCCFQWDICNPFPPGRYLEATFYQGSPTITQWRLALRPLDTGLEHCKYRVFLEFDDTNDDRSEVVAERVLLSIKLNGSLVLSKEDRNYHFCESNRCKYYFGKFLVSFHRAMRSNLEIKLDISLPREARENRETPVVSNDDCLERLSRSLGGLLSVEDINLDLTLNLPQENTYHNLNLMSRDNPRPFRTHTYMLHARWNNFFRVHAPQNTVHTNISQAVLSDILKYMYSGQFDKGKAVWRDLVYVSELFQVMDRYGLHHLHNVFVKGDSQQFRVTTHPIIKESLLYPLKFIKGRQITDATYAWNVVSDPGLTFRLIIRNEYQAGPWLSYSLQSSASKFRANVHLEIVKRSLEGNPLEEILPFHEQTHTMGPNETVESSCVLFLGCPETFDYTVIANLGCFIRCFFSVADGTTMDQLRSVADITLLDEPVRLGIFSDHMRQLQQESFDSDMTIRCNSGELQHRIHKGIFVSRCYHWWAALENPILLPDVKEAQFPENPICKLYSWNLRFVLDYMYTGRVFSLLPQSESRLLTEFANDSEFYALGDLFSSNSMVSLGMGLDFHGPDYELDLDGDRVAEGYVRDDRLGDVARGLVSGENFLADFVDKFLDER